MNRVYINPIKEFLELKNGINVLTIEQPLLFREIVFDLENELTFSNETSIIPFDDVIVINDCLNLNLNDRKNLTNLYKFLEKNASRENHERFQEIKNEILVLFKELLDTSPFSLDYDIDTTLSKIFSTFKLSFQEENKHNYLEYFLNYIRVIHELCNSKIIITFNLCDLFTEKEYELLIHELKIYEIEILDINLSHENSKKDTLIIDKDYCII